MADEGDVHAGLPVKFLLKGEDHGHSVYGIPDDVDPILPPGPYLGADVVEDLDPAPPGGAREREVEVRIVDQDDEIRRRLRKRALQAAHHPEDHPELEDHLRQSHHGHVGCVGQEFYPRRLHLFPPIP